MSEHQLKQQVAPGSPRETPLRAASLARAAARAKLIRSKGSVEGDDTDQLAIFGTVKPPEGFSYQLKRMSVWNQPTQAHQSMLLRNGWEPVPVERHPEAMPTGASGYIEKEGLLLMEIPTEIETEKRRLSENAARLPVDGLKARLAATPKGEAPRVFEESGRPAGFEGEQ